MNIFINKNKDIHTIMEFQTFLCRRCQQETSEWYYTKGKRDGMCKSCRKNYRKEEKREHTKKYISERKEHYKQLGDEWRKNNPDYQKKWEKNCPESRMLRSAKQRAKEIGLECSITQEDIYIPEICPVLKVPFQKGTRYAASLDRIDNSKGYVPGNVMVISRKANSMKNDATLEEIQLLAEFYTKLLS